MLRAIIAGQGGNDLLVRGVAAMVAMGGQLLGVALLRPGCCVRF